MITRQNIEHLTAEELAKLRAGYAAMQALSDNRSFSTISGYHDWPLRLCYHHEDALMFLPWHRGYLLTFEQFLRDHDSDLAVPYWDWTAPSSHQNGVPKAFSVTNQSGKHNPLHDSMIHAPTANPPVNRKSRRFPGDPSELPMPSDVQKVLGLSDFIKFSNQLQDIHDGIHGWTGGQNSQGVGGDMAFTTFAAYDPIFYSHHCMIDRLWDRWQQLHGINNIPSSILNRPLRGFDNLTVSSVLDTAKLGYSYASDEIVLDVHH